MKKTIKKVLGHSGDSNLVNSVKVSKPKITKTDAIDCETIANVYYLMRKHLGIERAKENLRKLRIIVNIISVNEKEVDLALNSELSDFEDGFILGNYRHKMRFLSSYEENYDCGR